MSRTVKIRKVSGPKAVDIPDLELFGVKNGDVIDVTAEMARNFVDGGQWERHTDDTPRPAARTRRPKSEPAPEPVSADDAPTPDDADPAPEAPAEPVETAEESE